MGFYWQRWRFPYERNSVWSQDIEQRRRWYKACEHVGVEQVRTMVRAAVDRGVGSPGAMAIGTEQNVVLGFCQEWLTWHDRRKAKREDARHWRQIFWPLIILVSLTVIGWIVARRV
jgi:hypothetical protein